MPLRTSERSKSNLALSAMQFESAEQAEKEQAKADLDKAKAKSDHFKGKVEDAADKKNAPKVEVNPSGTLESCRGQISMC